MPPDKLEDKYNHVLGPRCENGARLLLAALELLVRAHGVLEGGGVAGPLERLLGRNILVEELEELGQATVLLADHDLRPRKAYTTVSTSVSFMVDVCTVGRTLQQAPPAGWGIQRVSWQAFLQCRSALSCPPRHVRGPVQHGAA